MKKAANRRPFGLLLLFIDRAGTGAGECGGDDISHFMATAVELGL